MSKKSKDAFYEYFGNAIRCSVYGCKQNVRYYPYFKYNNIYCTSCNKLGLNGIKEYNKRLLSEIRRIIF